MLEFGPQNIYDAKENEQQHYEQVYTKNDTLEDLDEILEFFNTQTNHDETSILTLTAAELDPPNDSLPLVFPDLIDWDEPETHDIPIFLNDESIIHYLCTINPETDSTSKQSNDVCNQGSAKSLSRKNEQNKGSIAENQSMAAMDHKRVKKKDASEGENLFKATKDGRLDTLPEHYHERSPILIEPTQSINIGTTEAAKNIHLVESLTEEERSEFIKKFKEKQFNFAWSYADVPRIDP